jgi:hypothetical protein
VKSVVLQVSEIRDLGDASRYQFQERMNDYIVAPPDPSPSERIVHPRVPDNQPSRPRLPAAAPVV